jgi:hypothetical protein
MSSSDDEAGNELDSSSEPEPEAPVEKRGCKTSPDSPLREKLQPERVTSEICQPVPSEPLPPPPPPKLTKERREEIIREFKAGKEDSEYLVRKRKDGKFVVTKRKEIYVPTAKVSTPSHEEILERFKKDFRDELNQHKEYLTKKYKKYRDRQRQIEFTPWPPENLPPPVFEKEARPYVKPIKRENKYRRPRLDIRNF